MLSVGDIAPDFSSIDQFNTHLSLKKLKGHNIIVTFYPHDNSPSCTLQTCSLNETYEDWNKLNYKIIAISVDPMSSHICFSKKYGFKISLLSDTDMSIHKLYGVWDWKKFMGKEYIGCIRSTFIINKKGIITHILRNREVRTKNHGQQLLELIENY